MNDELQKALAAILTKTTSAVEAGVSLLQAELPDVIRQLLIWHAVKSFVFFIVFVSLTIACCYVTKRVWAWAIDEGNGAEVVAALPIIATALFGILSMNNIAWLQIWLAPKIFLIEYAASLAK